MINSLLHNRSVHRHLVYPAAVRLRGEGGVFKALTALRGLERMTPDYLRGRQESRLTDLLQYARARVPFYQKRWKSTPFGEANGFALLASLPLLERRDLQLHASELAAEPPPARVTRKTTGGSTGQAVTVLKDGEAVAREMAASWLSYSWFGVERGDRAVRFWGDPFTLKRRLRYVAADFAMNRLRFSAFAFDAQSLKSYWQQIDRFRPDYLYGYASMLTEFARFVREGGYRASELGLKVIISTSEVLTDAQRTLISETFGCPVQNEYGCGEMGPIAYSCEEGRLHVMSDNVVLEILRSDLTHADVGEAGELVLTDLNNRAMPLIRYRIGDFGAWAGRCACGRPSPALERVFGRAYDFVLGLDGMRYHGEFFMYLFEELRQHGYAVDQFQVFQTDGRSIRADVVTRTNIDAAITRHLSERLAKHLPGVSLTVRRVERIQRARSGKMRVIVNEMLKANEEESSLTPGGRASAEPVTAALGDR